MSVCMVFGIASFSACGLTDALDMTLELEELYDQVEELEAENEALKSEVATLKFENMYPDHVIGGEDVVELLKVKIEVEGDGDAVVASDKAQVTINGGSYDGGQTSFGGAGNTAVWVKSADAKVVINDGYFYIDGLAVDEEGNKDKGHIDLIYCSAGTIEINGGYFEGADSDVWLLNCKDDSYADGTASIVVKGGTFVNFDPSNCVSEGEGTNFVAEGYVVVKETVEGVDYYTVVEAPEEVEESTEDEIVEL